MPTIGSSASPTVPEVSGSCIATRSSGFSASYARCAADKGRRPARRALRPRCAAEAEPPGRGASARGPRARAWEKRSARAAAAGGAASCCTRKAAAWSKAAATSSSALAVSFGSSVSVMKSTVSATKRPMSPRSAAALSTLRLARPAEALSRASRSSSTSAQHLLLSSVACSRRITAFSGRGAATLRSPWTPWTPSSAPSGASGASAASASSRACCRTSAWLDRSPKDCRRRTRGRRRDAIALFMDERFSRHGVARGAPCALRGDSGDSGGGVDGAAAAAGAAPAAGPRTAPGAARPPRYGQKTSFAAAWNSIARSRAAP